MVVVLSNSLLVAVSSVKTSGGVMAVVWGDRV